MDAPPSYAASINPNQSTSTTPQPFQSDKFPSFLDPKDPRYLPYQVQLANARTERIKYVLHNYISPLIWENATSGIYRTALIIVPSDMVALRHAPKEKLVSPSPDAQLVRLTDTEGAWEFWRQRAVVSELIASIEADLEGWGAGFVPPTNPLNSDTVEIQGSQSLSPSTGLPPRPEPQPASRSSTSFWRRKRNNSANKNTDDAPSATDDSLTWRTEEELAKEKANKAKGGSLKDISVHVTLKSVTLRVESEMGLYEARTGEGVCIDVEMGPGN